MWYRSIKQILFTMFVALLGLALFGPFSGAVSAAGSCRVPSQYASIQAAVDDPACSDVEVAAGTYYENVVISRDVSIQGDAKGDTIVDGGNTSNVFRIEGAMTVSLSRLIIQNGSSFTEPYAGGGVANRDGHLTISKSTIRNNAAHVFGGGIWSATGSLSVSDSIITGNRADGGAGIAVGHEVSIRSTVISENIANNSGGGIAIIGVPNPTTGEITHSVIRNNRATYGGGLANLYENDLLVFKTQITNNHAEEWGGGIANAFRAVLTLKHSDVVQNTAGLLGGDLFNVEDATTIIERSTVGDIYNDAGGTILK